MLFDINYLRENTGGDAELEHELLTRLTQTITRCLSTLEGADNTEWKASLHEMRGAALAMGANHLGELCGESEHQPLHNKDTKKQVIQALHKTAEATLQEMQRLLSAQ